MNWSRMKCLLLWMISATLTHQVRIGECCIEKERIALLEISSYMKARVDPEYRQYFTGIDEVSQPRRQHHKPFNTFVPFSRGLGEYGARDEHNCCNWPRVHCNPTTQRVTRLNLGSMTASNNVMSVFQEWGQKPWAFNVTLFRPFKELISLDLSFNSISSLVEKDGSTRISTLRNLQTLMLDYNLLQDRVFLDDLTSLKKLTLRDCGLNQTNFPLQKLANLRKLQVLDLSNNFELNGPIQELAKFKELQVLDLSYNIFDGRINELATLRTLKVLRLTRNYFEGSIKDLCRLRSLVELRLQINPFYGDFPSCFHNLSSLQYLDISQNQFVGKFPTLLFNSTSLQYLDISNNVFEGKLSFRSFSNLTKLQVLRLSRNRLEVQTEDSSWQPSFQLQSLGLEGCSLNKPHGTIPKFLSQQHNLSDINLSGNNLVGSFPTWLLSSDSQALTVLNLANNSLSGYLKLPSHAILSLDTLTISGNNFQGELPENIGLSFPQLKYLDISRNRFQGHIPTSIGYMEQLSVLDLSHNNLSGEVPRQLFTDCEFLRILQLSDNNLQGEVIPEYMNQPLLQWLDLSSNNFSGAIKNSLLNSPGLFYLDVSSNRVIGHLPTWIGYFIELSTLVVSKNNMEGPIPTSICRIGNLIYLDLSHNNFRGSIPPCSDFSTLNYVHLHKNNLIGPLPTTLSSGSNLVTLDLRDNQLTDFIPPWINKLSKLQVLLLSGNNLQGQIPQALCQLKDIDILDLSHNYLSGEIPKCLRNMSFGLKGIEQQYSRLMTDYDISGGFYSMGDQVEFLEKNQYLSYIGGNLRLMSGLDLSSNKLMGVIPPELGDLVRAQSLNLSHNHLSGSIPIIFSNLKQVESLDLSYNNLSGTIPYELVDLNFLEIFNVSYNNLTGRTPDAGQFASFDDRKYLGNPRLCGQTLSKSCNPVPAAPLSPPTNITNKEDGGATFEIEDFLWSFGITSFIACMTTIVVLCINPQWRETWFDFVEWRLLWWLL